MCHAKKSFVLMLAALCLTVGLAQADLKEYVFRPDPSFAFNVVETRPLDGGEAIIARMVSQTWQDIVWTHWLIIFRPAELRYPDNVLLVVGGGDLSDDPPSLDSDEARAAAMIAQQTRSVAALITTVPNQPLFGGLHEDEIIAYTYDKFLRGEGNDWPLLMPMAKSAIRAMDAIQRILAEGPGQDVKGFVITGGSKRGWTSWLAAASGDPRIVGIAPAIIDMLNIVPQMQHQLDCYGAFSTQIDDYTALELQKRMMSDEGAQLRAIADPYLYRDALTLPKLIVLGANDPYWTVDAANFYFPGLKGPKYLVYQPNTRHDVTLDGISAVAHFFLALQQGQAYPDIAWESPEPGLLRVAWAREGGNAYLWTAASPNRDFREAVWSSTPLNGALAAEARVNAPETGWIAFFVEVRWPGEIGLDIINCTQVTVLPDTLPKQGAELLTK